MCDILLVEFWKLYLYLINTFLLISALSLKAKRLVSKGLLRGAERVFTPSGARAERGRMERGG